MTPEETPVPAPAETPTPAPEPVAAAPETPPSAPETPSAPSGAPPAPEDDRSIPPEDMWKAILDQSGGPFKASSDPLEAKEASKEVPRRTERVKPETTVVAAPPKKWAGRFESPEAMETAFQETEQARQRAETERQKTQAQSERLERLLAASLQGRTGAEPQAPAAAPPTQQELAQALERVKKESELLALGDPQGDPLQLVRAVAVASRLDQEARRHYADLALREMNSHNQATQQIQGIQDEFFKQFPDLKEARPSLLRLVAVEVETRLKQSRDDYGSAAYIQEWFNETAKEARASIRIGDGKVPVPSAAAPVRSATAPAPRPARGAPFAETPSPRSAEPALTGQEAHLARVFGGR